MNVPVTEEDAIRRAIRDGAAGDFCDVADVVRKKFGLTVGSGLVEKVYHKLQKDGEVERSDCSNTEKEAIKLGHVDMSLQSKIERPSVSKTVPKVTPTPSESSDRERILEFVHHMGGFAAARDAITQLEQSLKDLMK